MEQFKKILWRILHPGAILSILFAILGVGVLAFIFATGKDSTTLASISYPFTLYGLSVLVIGFPDIIAGTKALISKNKYGERYITDRKLRARISLYQGLFVNLLFAAFYAFTGWTSASVWFGAVAGYYVVLSGIRFILLHNVRKTSKQEDERVRYIHELKAYRLCGGLMLVLNFAMAGMIIQMVWQNKGYQYSGLTIYVSATYAFYCMIMAIVSIVTAHKMNSPVLSAAKMLSFAGALMSMLALQTAMITQFGEGQEDFRQIMNTATGGAVFLTVFAMAVYMVARGNQKLKKAQINNSQT